MDAEALCTCGCPYRRHVARLGRGAVVLACLKCPECEIFDLAPTVVAAPEPRTNEEAGSVGTPLLVDDHTGDVYWPTDLAAPGTLIRAWTSYRCERCEAMTWASDPVCHGKPMTPVRLEMHSREPL